MCRKSKHNRHPGLEPGAIFRPLHHAESPEDGPQIGSYRIHTSAPGVVALHYPNRLPSRKRGPPRIAVRGRPGFSSPSPRTARSGDPGPIPDSRGSPGSGSGAGPGRFALSPPAAAAQNAAIVRFAAFRAAAAAQNAAIVWFAAFRAASGIRDGSPPSRGRRKGGKGPRNPAVGRIRCTPLRDVCMR